MRIKKVFKMEIALKLVEMGYKIIYTEQNRNNKKLDVFCFLETEELLRDLEKLIKLTNPL